MKQKTYKRIELIAYILILFGICFVSIRMYFPEYFDMHSKNKLFVVVSDSMDPSISPNSLIIVSKKNKEYMVNDVITFRFDLNNDGFDEIITHRIHSIDNGVYRTKSDKYEKIDYWELKDTDIIGKVIYSIPYIGLIILGLQRVTMPIMFTLLLLIITLLSKTLLKWDIL